MEPRVFLLKLPSVFLGDMSDSLYLIHWFQRLELSTSVCNRLEKKNSAGAGLSFSDARCFAFSPTMSLVTGNVQNALTPEHTC